MAKRGRPPGKGKKKQKGKKQDLKVVPPDTPSETVEPPPPPPPPVAEEIPKVTSTPTEAQKIKIDTEKVLNFRILKLREQVIVLREENLKLLQQRTEAQQENLQLRKESLQKEQGNFFKYSGLAPGDKILPDPDGDGFCIHRPLLEKFSVGKTPNQG